MAQQPKLVATHVLPKYPEIYAITIDDVFSEEECKALIDQSEAGGYVQALVNIGRSEQVRMEDIRNNDRWIWDSDEMADKIYQRIKQFVPQTHRDGEYEAVSLNERLRFLRYTPGQEFKPHFDGNFVRESGPKKGEVSWFTLQLYLNNVQKGGETVFFPKNDDIPVDPKTGTVIIFQHNILHCGAPVYEGIKYVIRTDIMYKRKETTEPTE